MHLKTDKLHCFILLIVASMITPILAGKQPNVLIILTDDQGYGDLSLHGNPHIKTPHMDTLGKSGVRFERFYVSSVCAPTRAALLTGRWPLRTGCHGVTHLREAMRAEEITLAEVFRSAGYRTGCFGKWHNGAHYPFTPQGQGFETFLGFTAGHWNNYFNATLLRNSEPEKTEGYISDVLTDQAIGYITQDSNNPFFCLLAYNAPHSPLLKNIAIVYGLRFNSAPLICPPVKTDSLFWRYQCRATSLWILNI
jgi:arylsulfatase A-like enzyme